MRLKIEMERYPMGTCVEKTPRQRRPGWEFFQWLPGTLAEIGVIWLLTAPVVGQDILSRQELGFGLQFAKAVKLTGPENPHRSYCYVSLRWSRPLSRLSFLDRLPLASRSRLLLEPNGGYFHSPQHGYIGGLNLMFRTHLPPAGRFVPFFGFGGGGFFTNFVGLDSRFNFTLLAGLGLDFLITKNLSFQFEYRLHHISNGGIRLPNIGINSNFGSVGLSWYY